MLGQVCSKTLSNNATWPNAELISVHGTLVDALFPFGDEDNEVEGDAVDVVVGLVDCGALSVDAAVVLLLLVLSGGAAVGAPPKPSMRPGNITVDATIPRAADVMLVEGSSAVLLLLVLPVL